MCKRWATSSAGDPRRSAAGRPHGTSAAARRSLPAARGPTRGCTAAASGESRAARLGGPCRAVECASPLTASRDNWRDRAIAPCSASWRTIAPTHPHAGDPPRYSWSFSSTMIQLCWSASCATSSSPATRLASGRKRHVQHRTHCSRSPSNRGHRTASRSVGLDGGWRGPVMDRTDSVHSSQRRQCRSTRAAEVRSRSVSPRSERRSAPLTRGYPRRSPACAPRLRTSRPCSSAGLVGTALATGARDATPDVVFEEYNGLVCGTFYEAALSSRQHRPVRRGKRHLTTLMWGSPATVSWVRSRRPCPPAPGGIRGRSSGPATKNCNRTPPRTLL